MDECARTYKVYDRFQALGSSIIGGEIGLIARTTLKVSKSRTQALPNVSSVLSIHSSKEGRPSMHATRTCCSLSVPLRSTLAESWRMLAAEEGGGGGETGSAREVRVE